MFLVSGFDQISPTKTLSRIWHNNYNYYDEVVNYVIDKDDDNDYDEDDDDDDDDDDDADDNDDDADDDDHDDIIFQSS